MAILHAALAGGDGGLGDVAVQADDEALAFIAGTWMLVPAYIYVCLCEHPYIYAFV